MLKSWVAKNWFWVSFNEEMPSRMVLMEGVSVTESKMSPDCVPDIRTSESGNKIGLYDVDFVPSTASVSPTASGTCLDSNGVSVVACIGSMPGTSLILLSRPTLIGGACIGGVIVVGGTEEEEASEGNFGILGEDIFSSEEDVVVLITEFDVECEEIEGASSGVRS